MDWSEISTSEYEKEYRDYASGQDMWCEDCKEVVRARLYKDDSVGYSEWQCPVEEWHSLSKIKHCDCGNPMGDDDKMCPSCKADVTEKWWNLMKSVALKTETVLAFINEEVVGEF